MPIHGVQAYLKPAARTARASMAWRNIWLRHAGGAGWLALQAVLREARPSGCRDAAGRARAPDRWAGWEDPSAGP